jgi:DNA-binding NarL/FixJ family response regulator
MELIRVGIADDDPMIRQTLMLVLSSSPGIQVIAAVEDGEAAVKLACTEDLHVLILDIEMPKMNGVDALVEIRRLAPKVRVLIHSSRPSSTTAPSLIEAGASGYLQKPFALGRLVQAVTEVACL